MLSTHSFNALLKTLEEPPPHVKFLLATTDPQKLPVTILSRCLQFSLKRLPTALIARYLDTVLEQEGIPHEGTAVQLIARAGDGSMRDALSLLDQAIAFGGSRVEAAAVSAMLGSIDRRQVVSLLEALAANDAPMLLRQVAALDDLAPDYATVLAELLSLLQRVALIQVIPDTVPDDGTADLEDLQRLAQSLPPEDVQLFYQIALLGRRDLPLAPEPRGGFEMVLLRMLCFRPAAQDALLSAPPAVPVAAQSPAAAVQAAAPAPTSTPLTLRQAAPLQPLPAPAQPVSEWSALVEQLGLGGIAKQVALNCALIERAGNHFRLALEPSHAQMLTKTIEERLKVALEQHLDAPVTLKVQIGSVTATTPARQQAQQQAERRQVAAEQAAQDPHVRAMQELFNAQITAVRPVDETDG